MRHVIAVLLTIGIGDAAAAQDGSFCASLQRVIAAARETPSFRSLRGQADARGEFMGKVALLEGGSCTISRAKVDQVDRQIYGCSQDVKYRWSPETMRNPEPVAALKALVAPCLRVDGWQPSASAARDPSEIQYRVGTGAKEVIVSVYLYTAFKTSLNLNVRSAA